MQGSNVDVDVEIRLRATVGGWEEKERVGGMERVTCKIDSQREFAL